MLIEEWGWNISGLDRITANYHDKNMSGTNWFWQEWQQYTENGKVLSVDKYLCGYGASGHSKFTRGTSMSRLAGVKLLISITIPQTSPGAPEAVTQLHLVRCDKNRRILNAFVITREQ